MASFNGFDLGLVEEWSTTAAPKDRQVNAYPGVDGLEVLDLGARGGVTTLRGTLFGDNAAILADLKATLRAAQLDGGGYTLVDQEFTAWFPVILVMFRTAGPRYDMGDAGVAQRYEVEFLHV